MGKLIISLVCLTYLCGGINASPLEVQERFRGQNNPTSVGYQVRCRDTETSPGVFSYNCQGAPEDKITLNLDRSVQTQRGRGRNYNGGAGIVQDPQVLNIVVPNYKIRQIVPPQGNGAAKSNRNSKSTGPVNVNILLEKPKVYSELRQQNDYQFDQPGSLGTTPKPPQVNLHYEKVIGDKNRPFELVTPTNNENRDNEDKKIKPSNQRSKNAQQEQTTERGNRKETTNAKKNSSTEKPNPNDKSFSEFDTSNEHDADPRRQDLDMDYQPIDGFIRYQ